jgi:hypothetical protein
VAVSVEADDGLEERRGELKRERDQAALIAKRMRSAVVLAAGAVAGAALKVLAELMRNDGDGFPRKGEVMPAGSRQPNASGKRG